MFKKFPKLSKFINPEHLNEALRYIICHEGNFVACNGNTLMWVGLKDIVTTCKTFDTDSDYTLLEGKALSPQMIKSMERAKVIQIREDGLVCDNEFIPFTHHLQGLNIWEGDKHITQYPFYKGVIPDEESYEDGNGAFTFIFSHLAAFSELVMYDFTPTTIRTNKDNKKVAMVQTSCEEFDYTAKMIVQPYIKF